MSAEQNASHNSALRKQLLIGLTVVFLSIGIIVLFYWIFFGQFHETTDDAYVGGNLIQVMPQISGHVTAIYADETNLVKKDDPLVLLDKADADVALRNAEARLALTARQVSQFYKNVDESKANVQLQQENLIKAQDDLKRREGLVVNKVISREDLEHARIAVNSAQAALTLAKNQLAAAIALVANSDLYNHPQVQQAIVNLRNAYLNWQRTTIQAPVTGYIAKRPVQVGQEVNPSSVLMVIVPLNQIWVNANFKESQLKNIRINQPAELIADAYGNSVKFHGTIIGLSPGAGNTFDLLPPQNATGNWIKIVQRLPVRIGIDPEQLAEHPLRLGLSITVSVSTRDRNGPSLSQVPQTNIIYQTKDYSSELERANTLINDILQKNAPNISYPQ